jgi:hypothetical protein
MDFKKIILGVIVTIILYLVYIYVFSDGTSSVLTSGGNAQNLTTIKASKLPGNKGSVDFTFSIWIYVKNWTTKYGMEKIIYRRGKPATLIYSPQVSLGASTNDLNIKMATFGTDNQSPSQVTEDWKINNIPIQKWCNIIISTNNRAVDTYIDGKLVNTHVLKGVAFLDKTAPVELTPDKGFAGETSKFRYIARTISPREAYEIYRDGPGGNWLSDLLNQYKLKLAFLKDNEEVQSFEI